jgi:hypothetical protein
MSPVRLKVLWRLGMWEASASMDERMLVSSDSLRQPGSHHMQMRTFLPGVGLNPWYCPQRPHDDSYNQFPALETSQEPPTSQASPVQQAVAAFPHVHQYSINSMTGFSIQEESYLVRLFSPAHCIWPPAARKRSCSAAGSPGYPALHQSRPHPHRSPPLPRFPRSLAGCP